MEHERAPSQPEPPLPPGANIRNLLRIVDGLLIVLLAGAAFLFVIHFLVVDNRVMPVTRARLVAMHEFLETQAAAGEFGDVYFLGSSVLLEGVDCRIIDERLPAGIESYNLSLMGAGAPQWILLAPALRRARPSWVVMTVDMTGVTGLQKIPEEGMAIAEYWDFFTPESERRFARFFSEEQKRALDNSDIASLLAFRVFPIGAFDMYMREVSRPELRYDGYTTNVKNPWVRKQQVSEESTERWIAGKVSKVDEQTPEQMDEQIAMIAELIDYFAEAGIGSAVCVAPVNPKLSAALGETESERILRALRDLCARTDTPLLNHRTLLAADQFADHVHPYEPGRVKWSRVLAAEIAALAAPTTRASEADTSAGEAR